MTADSNGRRNGGGDALLHEWAAPRWRGIRRPYAVADVHRLRGSVAVEHTLARRGAERLWSLLQSRDYVAALGAVTGNQAVQMAEAGPEAFYLSGWPVAADAERSGPAPPGPRLYPRHI